MFDFILKRNKPDAVENFLTVRGRQIPLAVIRNHRARRYLLRLHPDGLVRLTIPGRGSVIEGRRFAERHTEWLARQLERLSAQPLKPKQWLIGTEILFRGEMIKLEAGVNGESGMIRFASEAVKVTGHGADLRPAIERHLWRLAAKELPPRVLEYAALHQLPVRRTISLNWRLIQTPPFVRDYILIHEIMHLREMNHSSRFWREVERACPDYKTAERWLKQHSSLLK